MIVLETIPHETIWGGGKLTPFATVNSTKIGHLYSVYSRKDNSNLALNGRYRGRNLNDIFNEIKVKYGMNQYEYFPLTIALVDASENLSIQVHPDEETAKTMEGVALGKRESWYFIQEPTNGYIYNGCNCNSKKEVLDRVKKNEMGIITDTLRVAECNYVFIEPGTLHAMTSGSLVYEIEEGSDYTYRFFDYDRLDMYGNKRELHITKAVESLNSTLKSTTKSYKDTSEIIEKTYSTKKVCNSNRYENKSNTLEVLTIIKGELTCDNVLMNTGMSVILEPEEKLENIFIEEAIVAKKL